MSVHVRACVFIKCVCVCLCSYKPNFHGWSHMLLPGNAACCRECFPPSFFFCVCMCVYVATLRAAPQAPAYYNCYVLFFF